MAIGVHGQVMVYVQSHVGGDDKQEVVPVTILHLPMVENHVLVKVPKLELAVPMVVQVHFLNFVQIVLPVVHIANSFTNICTFIFHKA